MLAAYYRTTGSLSLEETDIPEPKAHELQIQIKVTTVCGSTDMKIIKGLRDHAFGRDIILGHESSGIVTKVGELVSGFKVGDRVACEAWGTYAQYVCCTTDKVQLLPMNTTWTQGAVAELLLKVYQMCAGKILPGDTVAILGQGSAGLLFTQMAKLMGASRIVVSDLVSAKLDLARRFGATATINASLENQNEQDIISQFMDYTDGKGADVVIEAAGVVDTVKLSPYVTKRYGATILQFGVVPFETPYSFSRTHDYGQTILTIGSCRFIDSTLPYKRAVQLISEGQIDVHSLITHTFKLSQINKAFTLLREQPEEVIKIAITI